MEELGSGKVDDLATLVTLDEDGLLKEIKARHQDDNIYTYIGDILIAVNPYKTLPIYNAEYQSRYRGLKERNQQPPHIFAVSDKVYQSLVTTGQNQCCVVSGESGAGKTESTKYMVKHIAELCHHDSSDLHERIVQVNPLLEAFGNAQTVINNNSSRFGKFIQIDFTPEGSILGAHISEYLLEKSRVVSQALGERNFHIFYYLFAGLSPELLEANKLRNPNDYRIMRPVDGSPVFKDADQQEKCKQMWEELQTLFVSTGFEEGQVDSILATMAAILHLTNIEFQDNDDSNSDGVLIKNEESMEMAAELLVVDKQSLATALVSNTQTLPTGENLIAFKNMTSANDGRDALAKALYGRMFAWTVKQVNFLLKTATRGKMPMGRKIGILDLAGFENFQNNSFEQLCINVANEQLHFYFNQHIFLLEMEEYKKEGIEGKDIKFIDNTEIVKLFMTPGTGLFAMLDEQLRLPGATDRTFTDKVEKDYSGEHIRRPKGQQLNFIVTHYAGQVIYNCDNFLEKNRDTLSVNLMDCMKSSESQFIAELFHTPIVRTGSMQIRFDAPKRSRMSVLLAKKPKLVAASPDGSKNRFSRTASTMAKNKKYTAVGTLGRRAKDDGTGQTMAMHFSSSLTHLMEKLNAGEPHFIRCIKPNSNKFPDIFLDDMVLQQLRYTGVLETVKIRRQGYATRLPFDMFLRRYKFGYFTMTDETQPTKENCALVLQHLGLKDYEIGNTKVFLRYWHTEQLQLYMDKLYRSIIQCQKHVRLFLARAELKRRRERAAREAEMLRSLCSEVMELSDNLYTVQCQQCEFDKSEHIRKENERLEKERKEKAERDRKERERLEREEKQRREEEERRLKEEQERKAEEQQRQQEKQRRELAQKEEEQRQRQVDITREAERKKSERELEKIEEDIAVQQLDDVLEVQDEPPVLDPPVENTVFHAEDNIPPPPPNIVSQSKLFIWELLQLALERYDQLSSQIWAKVFYVEKGELVGKVYLRDWDVVINGTDCKYDGKVIGLRYENFDNPMRDLESEQALDKVGEGVEIARDEDGNILVRNLSKESIIAKDYTNPASSCLSDDLVNSLGQIPKWPVKIFDVEKYKSLIAQELKKPEISIGNLQMNAVVSFAFGRNSMNDFATPSWMFIINFAAIELLGDDAILQDLIRKGRLDVNNDRQLRLKRQWAEMYRPRRQSTDSMRMSTAITSQPPGQMSQASAMPAPTGTVGPSFSRSEQNNNKGGGTPQKLKKPNLLKGLFKKS